MTVHESIRKRPGMYIGRVGSSGLSYLLGDLILDCATDFHAKEIRIELRKSGKIVCVLRKAEIAHDALKNKVEGKPEQNGHFGTWSITACVALSTSFVLTLGRRNHRITHDGIARPVLAAKATKKYRELRMVFTPDVKVFGNTGPEGMMFYQRMSEVSLTMPDVKIILHSNYTKPFTQIVAHAEKGMQHLLDLEASRCFGREFEHCIDFDTEGVRGQVGWFYCNWYGANPQVMAFANGRTTNQGGSHVAGVVEGIQDAVTAKIAGREEEYFVEVSRVIKNLCLAVSVWGEDFRYAGSTKDCLEHEQTQTTIRKVVRNHLEKWMKKSPKQGDEFIALFRKDWPFPNPVELIKQLTK